MGFQSRRPISHQESGAGRAGFPRAPGRTESAFPVPGREPGRAATSVPEGGGVPGSRDPGAPGRVLRVSVVPPTDRRGPGSVPATGTDLGRPGSSPSGARAGGSRPAFLRHVDVPPPRKNLWKKYPQASLTNRQTDTSLRCHLQSIRDVGAGSRLSVNPPPTDALA